MRICQPPVIPEGTVQIRDMLSYLYTYGSSIVDHSIIIPNRLGYVGATNTISSRFARSYDSIS